MGRIYNTKTIKGAKTAVDAWVGMQRGYAQMEEFEPDSTFGTMGTATAFVEIPVPFEGLTMLGISVTDWMEAIAGVNNSSAIKPHATISGAGGTVGVVKLSEGSDGEGEYVFFGWCYE